MMEIIIGAIAGLIIGGVAVAVVMWLILKPRTEAEYAKLEQAKEESRQAAEREAQKIISNSQEDAKATRLEADRVVKQRYSDLARAEERLDSRQASLDKQSQRLEKREQILNKRQSR